VIFLPKLLQRDQDNLRMKLNWCCRASHEHFLFDKPDRRSHSRQSCAAKCSSMRRVTLLEPKQETIRIE